MSAIRDIIEEFFMIPDKERRDVDFILTPEQAELDENLARRNIVPKARQIHVTSYCLARHLALCLSERNRVCVTVSYEIKATQRLLQRVHYMLDHFKGGKAETAYSNKNEITFPKTDSSFFIGTAGSTDFGQGDTITDLHCSEVALWENPQKILSPLLQSVTPDGTVIMESRGAGAGNFYHRQVLRARDGKGYKLHFLNWLRRPEYTAKVPADFQLLEEYEELELENILSPAQIMWRRGKIDEDFDGDVSLFREQYPITLDECFQTKGHSIFKRTYYIKSPLWRKTAAGLFVLDGHPKKGYTYAIGLDSSGGVVETTDAEEAGHSSRGGDNSCAQIGCLQTNEQVGEFVSNKIEPDEFGEKAIELGRMFNNAYLSVERNNHGILTLDTILRSDYPKYLVHRATVTQETENREWGRIADYGLFTSAASKGLMIGRTRRELALGFKFYSERLKGELSTFVEHANGKFAAQEGCMDDTVMALACLLYTWEKAGIVLAPEEPATVVPVMKPFTLEGIMKELEDKFSSNNFPIRDQSDWTVH